MVHENDNNLYILMNIRTCCPVSGLDYKDAALRGWTKTMVNS